MKNTPSIGVQLSRRMLKYLKVSTITAHSRSDKGADDPPPTSSFTLALQLLVTSLGEKNTVDLKPLAVHPTPT